MGSSLTITSKISIKVSLTNPCKIRIKVSLTIKIRISRRTTISSITINSITIETLDKIITSMEIIRIGITTRAGITTIRTSTLTQIKVGTITISGTTIGISSPGEIKATIRATIAIRIA